MFVLAQQCGFQVVTNICYGHSTLHCYEQAIFFPYYTARLTVTGCSSIFSCDLLVLFFLWGQSFKRRETFNWKSLHSFKSRWNTASNLSYALTDLQPIISCINKTAASCCCQVSTSIAKTSQLIRALFIFYNTDMWNMLSSCIFQCLLFWGALIILYFILVSIDIKTAHCLICDHFLPPI